MSASILGGDFEVHFTNDSAGNGDLQITWEGSATGTRTVNELYSALEDLFDNDDGAGTPAGLYMDEGIPMSASTPTQYTIGEIETNDNEPWFIDPETVNHLTGGAINTTGWERSPFPADGTGNIGILRVQCSSSNFNMVSTDVGDGCTDDTNSDSGKILYVDTVNFQVWIRPDDNQLANDFNTGSSTISADTSGNTVTYSAVATTGDLAWSNPFTIGNIVSNTRIYVYQGFSEITNFWGEGHLDRLFITYDKFDTSLASYSYLIDYGKLTFFARQYGTLYDYSIATFDNGGRAPVALSASNDTNNNTGYWTMSISSATGSYQNGELITGDVSGASGVIASATGSPTTSIEYYLVADRTVNFQNGDTITGATSGVNDGVAGTPAATSGGPTSLPFSVTINFGADLQDIGDGDGNQPYDVVINLGGNTLSDFYEYTKYITGRGYTSDLDPNADQTVTGESYLGVGDIFVAYDGASTDPPFNEGEVVRNLSTDFYGVITSVHDTGTNVGFLTLRDTRGTALANNDTLTGDDSSDTVLVNTDTDAIENITQLRATPFGSFAGGQFFGARGVWITNMDAGDANNYSLIDSYGEPHSPPASIAISVGGLVSGDRVTMFRATGDNNIVDKTIFTSAASGNNNAGDADFIVTVTIDTNQGDTPSSGKIRVVNNSGDGSEQRYRYASWSGSTFTFISGAVGSATAGSSGNTLVDSGADFGGTDDVEVGDVIRNTSTSESGKVTKIVDSNTLTTSGLTSGWSVGNNYTTNVLDRNYDGTDTAYVPYIDQEATGATASVSVTYETDRYVTTRVRRLGILPFTVKGQINSSGITVTAIRNPDTIADLPG